ncbi:MAG: hypothetical protein ACTSV5_15290 [Promethearchaeota archaeon]
MLNWKCFITSDNLAIQGEFSDMFILHWFFLKKLQFSAEIIFKYCDLAKKYSLRKKGKTPSV